MEASGRAGGGVGGCEMDECDCAACRQHCYWNHPTGRRRQFIVRASDGFRDGVCIPQEAAKQLRNMIPYSEPIKLEARDGRMYDVACRRFGGICLTTGWREFVDANHIREGDSILFVYCGGSSFRVDILSSSGHGNSLPCSQQPPGILRAVPPRDRHVLNEHVVPDPAHVQTSTEFGYTAFPGTRLTEAQEKKVLELAESSMGSEFPLHVAAVNKRNANEGCYVHIPLRLLDNFKEGITIQLEAHGNKILYSVGASKHGDDQIILQSGLSIFVASHRIQENDLLIFRSKGKTCLVVLVLDPRGCEKTSCFAMGNSSGAQETREDTVEILDKKPPLPPTVIELSSDDDEVTDLSSEDDEVVGKDTTTSRREQRPLRSCCAKAEKMASTSCPSTKSGHKAGNSNGAGLEAPMSNKPYILPQAGTTKLTAQQEEKVKEKVRAIGSEFPVFVKVMTPKDVGRPGPAHLAFCVEYASACHLPLKQTPLLLRLEGSDMWWPSTLTVLKYKEGRRIHKGWMGLVSQAGMEVGDLCLVELVDRSSERLTMRVHLIRRSEMQL